MNVDAPHMYQIAEYETREKPRRHPHFLSYLTKILGRRKEWILGDRLLNLEIAESRRAGNCGLQYRPTVAE
jgi:hypothetical protein